MRNKVFIILYLSLFIFGCETLPPVLEKPIEKTRTFNASFDEVWKAAVQSFTSSGELVGVAQKDSGLISFQRNIPPEVVNKVALAPEGMAWVSATAVVSVLFSCVDTKQVTVTINMRIWGVGRNQWDTALYGPNAHTQQIEMGTRGVLEKEYFDKIEALLPTKTYDWLETKPQGTIQGATQGATNAIKAGASYGSGGSE